MSTFAKKALWVIGALATIYAMLLAVTGTLSSVYCLYSMFRYSYYGDAILTPFIVTTMYAAMGSYLTYEGVKAFFIRR